MQRQRFGSILTTALAIAAAVVMTGCDPGPPGPAGPAGPPGVSGYEIVEVVRTLSMAPGDSGQFLTATCPEGKKVLGGGYVSGGFFTFMNSAPVNDNSWQVLAVNRHGSTFTADVTVKAICADVS